jgi:hypothetical protein
MISPPQTISWSAAIIRQISHPGANFFGIRFAALMWPYPHWQFYYSGVTF